LVSKKKLPIRIIYEVTDECIIIADVFHTSQHPSKIQLFNQPKSLQIKGTKPVEKPAHIVSTLVNPNYWQPSWSGFAIQTSLIQDLQSGQHLSLQTQLQRPSFPCWRRFVFVPNCSRIHFCLFDILKLLCISILAY
jgi:hypothetical protein